MIRRFQETDTGQVMEIWLRGNLEAHEFISEDYWRSNFAMVQEQLLQAEVFVCEADGEIQGFLGMAEGVIAGIFVEAKHRSLGVGKQLIDYAKQRYGSLILNVYQKNKRAAAFYLREGFEILSEGLDEATKEAEYTMFWRAGQEGRSCP